MTKPAIKDTVSLDPHVVALPSRIGGGSVSDVNNMNM
jgi:hypothetical protein